MELENPCERFVMPVCETLSDILIFGNRRFVAHKQGFPSLVFVCSFACLFVCSLFVCLFVWMLVCLFSYILHLFMALDWIQFLCFTGTQTPGRVNVWVVRGECRSKCYKVFKDCDWRAKSSIPGLKSITWSSFIRLKKWHECLNNTLRTLNIIVEKTAREKKGAVPLFCSHICSYFLCHARLFVRQIIFPTQPHNATIA